MRRDDRRHQRGGLIGAGIRGISGGIGLASESIKARNAAKNAEKERQSVSRTHSTEADRSGPVTPPITGPPPPYSEDPDGKSSQYANPDEKVRAQEEPADEVADELEDNLEDEWNLDDAQDEVTGTPLEDPQGKDPSKPDEKFLRDHPPPKTKLVGQLPMPVVLPQRRPKERSRGFIRAYAPLLENCGIDQTTWLEFLDVFQKASAANPWISAINLASFATLAIPSGFGVLVSVAIRQATNLAIEMQSRERTSDFLQKINEHFFKPRGLFCLVMTWKPESSHRSEQVNVMAKVASRGQPSTGFSSFQNKFRSSDGTTRGDLEFPEVAPLIFPSLDQLATQSGAEGAQKKGKMAESMGFVGNYWDKRAAARYAAENPNSVLAQHPQETFQSRYADPTHPASSGSLISFVSGGKLVPGPNSRGLIGGVASVIGQAVRGVPQGSEWETANPRHGDPYRYGDPYSRGYRGRGRRRGRDGPRDGLISTPVGAARKLLKQNVLYLMVVNMPSEEEMAAALITAQQQH